MLFQPAAGYLIAQDYKQGETASLALTKKTDNPHLLNVTNADIPTKSSASRFVHVGKGSSRDDRDNYTQRKKVPLRLVEIKTHYYHYIL